MSEAYAFINTMRLIAKNSNNCAISYEKRDFRCPGVDGGDYSIDWTEVGDTHIVHFTTITDEVDVRSASFVADGCLYWENGGKCGRAEISGTDCNRKATGNNYAVGDVNKVLLEGLKLVNRK